MTGYKKSIQTCVINKDGKEFTTECLSKEHFQCEIANKIHIAKRFRMQKNVCMEVTGLNPSVEWW